MVVHELEPRGLPVRCKLVCTTSTCERQRVNRGARHDAAKLFLGAPGPRCREWSCWLPRARRRLHSLSRGLARTDLAVTLMLDRNTSHATVALCIAGQLRTLVNTSVQDHWEATLLRLRPAIFLQVSAQNSLPLGRGHAANGDANDDERIRRLLAWLQPTAARIANDTELLATINTTAQAEMKRHGTGRLIYGGLIGTLAIRWEQCLADISSSERARGFAYHWVMRARPDLAFRCRLPPVHQWPVLSRGRSRAEPRTVWLMADYLAIAPRSLASAILGLRRRLTDQHARPCGAPMLEHDACLDTLLHEHGAGVCEIAPRAHLLRFANLDRGLRPRAQGDLMPECINGWDAHYAPAAAAAATSNASRFCFAPAALLRPCGGAFVGGFWRCRGVNATLAWEWREADGALHAASGIANIKWWRQNAE